MLPEYRAYAKGNDGNVSLRILAERVLEWQIQEKSHSSVVDARATMKLYLLHRDEIDGAQSRANLTSSSTSLNEDHDGLPESDDMDSDPRSPSSGTSEAHLSRVSLQVLSL